MNYWILFCTFGAQGQALEVAAIVDPAPEVLAAWRLEPSGAPTGEIILLNEREGLEYTVLASVTIGNRHHEWSESGLDVPGSVRIPEEALMVELQRGAMSQLLVVVEARRADNGALVWREGLPDLAVIWSASPHAGPRWLTWPDAEREAPGGIIGRVPLIDDEPTVMVGGVPANLVDASREVVR